MKILVVGPSWIGDTILAQPLMKLLHERHRDLKLDMLAPAWTFPVVERMQEVRQAIPSPFAHGELNFSERRALGRALRTESYDQAIVLPNTLKASFVPWFARIPRRTGYRGEMRWGMLNDVRSLDKQSLPQMPQRYAALGLERGKTLPAVLPQPRLESAASKRMQTLKALGLDPAARIVARCVRGPNTVPRSAGRLRIPLSSRTRALARRRDRPARRLDEGCTDLRGHRAALRRSVQKSVRRDDARPGDRRSRSLAARDHQRLGIDAHRRGTRTPLIAIYGSSTPEHTPPMSPRATIVKLDIPCSPCFERTCPLGHFNCMMQLKPERVLAHALVPATAANDTRA